METLSINQKTAHRFQKPEPGVLKEEFSPISHIGLGSSFRVIQIERGLPQASEAPKTL
jgi:hypothetical protein